MPENPRRPESSCSVSPRRAASRRRIAGRLAVMAAAPVLLVAAACSESGSDAIPSSGERESTTTTTVATTTTAPATGVSGEWAIDGLTAAGTETAAPEGASLTFQGGVVDVETGCNIGHAPAEVGEGTITLGELALTRMACTDPALSDWETSLTGFLTGEVAFEVSEDALVLRRGADSLALRTVEAP
jgi:heat shock protein HslJ